MIHIITQRTHTLKINSLLRGAQTHTLKDKGSDSHCNTYYYYSSTHTQYSKRVGKKQNDDSWSRSCDTTTIDVSCTQYYGHRHATKNTVATTYIHGHHHIHGTASHHTRVHIVVHTLKKRTQSYDCLHHIAWRRCFNRSYMCSR